MKKLLAFAVFLSIFITAQTSNANAATTKKCGVVSESLSSNSVLQNSKLTWIVKSSCPNPPYIMNNEQGVGYLCGSGVCVHVNGKSVKNSYTYTFIFTVPLNFPTGSATLKMTARGSDYVTIQEINSNFIIAIDAMAATTTTIAPTTTIPPTTIPHPPISVCWSGRVNNYGQDDDWKLIEVTYHNNRYHYPNGYGTKKYVPVPPGGCSSLNPVPPTPTTTLPVTTTSPPVTTTVPSPRWIHYCVPYNSYTWFQATLDSLYYTYPPSAVYPVPSGGCSSLNTTPPIVYREPPTTTPIPPVTTTIPPVTTTIPPVTIEKFVPPTVKPIYFAVPKITTPASSPPAVEIPASTKPVVKFTEPLKEKIPTIKQKQKWSYVFKNTPVFINTGALCRNGKIATSVDSCKNHGGFSKWITKKSKSNSSTKYKCWLNNKTNTYNKNCKAV